MVPLLAALAWCSMIFWFSHQSDMSVSDDDTIDFIVRKAAHMVEYGALLLLTLWTLATTLRMPHSRLRTAIAFGFVIAYAVSDEYHQSFIEGRVGHPRDVAIDVLGAIVTYGLFQLLLKRRNRA